MTAPTSPHAPLWLMILLQATVSAASMVVEIVAGRMIAPYVGMSLYTWTAIIAVVLAGLSVGHWWGGRIAVLETGRALRRAAWCMVAAALATAGASLLLRATAGPVLGALTHPLAAITAISSLAFFLPSLFAGVPAPILSVAAMRGRQKSEQALGAMFAAGAVGAIAGTLLAGFLFVAWLGSVASLTVIAAVYAVSALACLALAGASRGQWVTAGGTLALALLLTVSALRLPAVCDRESSYFCIRTVQLSENAEAPVRLMVLDHLAHGISAREDPRVMFTDHTAMLDALPRMRIGDRDFTSFHIGGGSYSVPRAWADRGITGITVAEIDPEVTARAVADFWFDPDTVTVLHRDARIALRDSAAPFDVIIGDAFTDIAVPEHLVTREFFELVRDRLAPEGVFAMNLIDSTDRLDALAAIVETLRAVFPSVEVWTEARPPEPGERRIFVLLAGAQDSPVSTITTRAPQEIRFAALGPEFIDSVLTAKEPMVLTDDHAPVSRLMGLDPVID
ncbi:MULTISPECIES: fused MFS/spermidine synthase [unclassified Mameliella]|uniref:fused MFS/spermidine synthase n=1 Tax=unclassified Mameliella TaxID=2630630 RepID=UPI00273EB927|nr:MULTISPECIES: fused MFS/spermidine synthase [unclassified Mameliella]